MTDRSRRTDGGTTEPADRTGEPAADAGATATDLSPVACARELLVAVRTGDDTGPYREALAAAGHADLAPLREDRATALAFWTNVYNSGTQLLLSRRPDLYESSLRALRFFRATAVTVGGVDLSLDDIEHGILRGGRSKYGLGYTPRLFSGRFERRYRLSDPDHRVHFALNCGAASCPAIRAYEASRIDDQLDLATRTYLDSTVEYDGDAGVVRVPRIFLWYRGDFGGKSGTRAFLCRYDAIPEDATPAVEYEPWDWTKAAGKFAGTD